MVRLFIDQPGNAAPHQYWAAAPGADDLWPPNCAICTHFRDKDGKLDSVPCGEHPPRQRRRG